MIKIGILREGKIPVDKRVPLVPSHITQLTTRYPDFKICVQTSDIRCYPDSEYRELGIEVTKNVGDYDILMGVKEVPVPELIAEKTYFFFSHTTKEQPYNRGLLKAILDKRITLIDYEGLTNKHGRRIVAFGRYAGIVGAYNGLLTYGLKHNLYRVRRAHDCFDLEDLKSEFEKIKLPHIKIVLTGGGRVSGGAMEVLDGAGIRKVSPNEFLTSEYEEAVYTQLHSHDYNKHKDETVFTDDDFHQNPKGYLSDFLKYAHKADILVAGSYWHPDAPVLFTTDDLQEEIFKINVIADITCDIEGSIPTTLRPTTIDEPFYDYNPKTLSEEPGFSSNKNITVMAIDNLPNELPRNASQDFGTELVNNVLPLFIKGDDDGILERATITRDGELTNKYKYLEGYVNGSE